MGRTTGALLAALLLLACSSEPADPAPPDWECPAGWVEYLEGGCGPAELLCAGGGGAVAGACDAIDPALLAGPACAAEDFEPENAGLATCPDGWPRAEDGACDPSLRTDCAEGSSPLPGGACTPTGADACPAGEYAEPPPGATFLLHVRAGADPAVADGTVERPFATINAAVSRAGSAGIVLVAAGEYPETLLLSGMVQVVGVCAARVTIAGGDAVARTPAVYALRAGSHVQVRGVTIRSAHYGVLAGMGARLTVRASRLEECPGFTASAQLEGTLELEDVRIADTRAIGDGTLGIALQVDRAGHLVARRVSIERARDRAINVNGGGSTLELEDVLVRDTAPRPSGNNGIGIWIDETASASARRLVIDGYSAAAAFVEAASFDAEDLVMQRTTAGADAGPVLRAGMGATVTLRDVAVRGGVWWGLGAHGAGTTLDVDGCLVRDIVASAEDPLTGAGLSATGEAVVTAARCRIAEATGFGVVATAPGSRVTITDSRVEDTRPSSVDPFLGLGLLAHGGGTVEATRVRVERATGVGLLATSIETDPPRLVFRDGLVRDTRHNDYGYADGAVAAGAGTVLEMTGTRVQHIASAAVVATEGARLEVSDTCVADVTPNRDLRVGGWGLGAARGATLIARRVSIDRCTEYGVLAAWLGASADLEDVIIRDVVPAAWGYGIGVSAEQEGSISARRLGIQRVAGAAAMAVANDSGAVGRLSLADVFATDVAASWVDFDEDAIEPTPAGPRVAYGVHAGPGCELDVSHLVIDRVGFGFFAGGGSIRVSGGVVTGALDAAGAIGAEETRDDVSLVDVVLRGNALDRVVVRPDLPSGSALPQPAAVCLDPAECG